MFTKCKQLLTFKSSGALNGEAIGTCQGLTDNLKSFKLFYLVICNLLCLSSSVFMDFIFSSTLFRSKLSNVLVCCVNNIYLASFRVAFLLYSLECVLNCSFFQTYVNIMYCLLTKTLIGFSIIGSAFLLDDSLLSMLVLISIISIFTDSLL